MIPELRELRDDLCAQNEPNASKPLNVADQDLKYEVIEADLAGAQRR